MNTYLATSANHKSDHTARFYARKIKNSKILRWRLDLAEYRVGKNNTAEDALCNAHCSNMTENVLNTKHVKLIHPGVIRLYHHVKVKTLPCSLAEVRETVARCKMCAEMKPQFLKPLNPLLIKAKQPLERLNINF